MCGKRCLTERAHCILVVHPRTAARKRIRDMSVDLSKFIFLNAATSRPASSIFDVLKELHRNVNRFQR